MSTARHWLEQSWLAQLLVSVGLAVLVGVAVGGASLVSPFASIALIVALVGLVVLAPRPILLCYMVIAAIAFTSAMQRGDLLPLLVPNEAMLVVAFGFGILYVWANRVGRRLPGMLLAGIAVMVLGTVLIPTFSYVIRGYSLSTSEIFSLFAPLQYLLLFWLFAYIPQSDAQRRNIIQLLFLCSSVISLVGLLQAAGIDAVVSFLQTWYPSGHLEDAAEAGRVTSLLGTWNTLGTFLMLNLLLLAALQNEKHPRLHQINMIVCLGLSFVCLIASGSYASLFGLAMGFVIIKLFDPRGLKALLPVFIIGVIGVIALLPLISERFMAQFFSTAITENEGIIPQTLVYRFRVWEEIYIPIIMRDPWWGINPTFANVSFAYAESQYLFLLFRSGVISLVAHLAWIGIWLVWLYDFARSSSGMSRMIAVTIFTNLIVLSIMGWTNPVFTYSGSIDYLWILLGLVVNSREVKFHHVRS